MGSIFSSYQEKNSADTATDNFITAPEPPDTDDEFFDSESNCNEFLKPDMATVKLNDETHKKEDLITDAVEARTSVSQMRFKSPSELTPEHVDQLEQDLDFYEKVALVFLLYENADIALQGLLIEESHEQNQMHTSANLISKWARSKHINNWQNQLLEALCIIQNYAIVEKLGYDKELLNIRYLPSNVYTPLSINQSRKALYHVCENFNKAKTREFLQYLQKDFDSKNISFQKYSERYLEMYFLYCFTRHYVNNDNLENIIKILKQMGQDMMCDMLRSIVGVEKLPKQVTPIKVEVKKQESDYAQEEVKPGFLINSEAHDQNFVKNEQNCSENSVIGDNSYISTNYDKDICYAIDPNNVGICLIINQRTFYRETDKKLELLVSIEPLKDRDGTDIDRNTLKKTFESIGFRTKVVENLTHSEIEHEVRNVMKIFSKKDSCLIVCILSHGREGQVFGVNSIGVSISEIENVLYSREYPTVLGKPKVLIIQSCQGTPLQEVLNFDEETNTIDGPIPQTPQKESVCDYDIVTDGPTCVLEKADLLTCCSTVAGYASIRNPEKGTWYIQELCQVLLKEGSSKHFSDILLIVNNNLTSRKWFSRTEKKNVSMVSEHTSSMRKMLFLPVPKLVSSSLP